VKRVVIRRLSCLMDRGGISARMVEAKVRNGNSRFLIPQGKETGAEEV
jgi:hypothetical protein